MLIDRNSVSSVSISLNTVLAQFITQWLSSARDHIPQNCQQPFLFTSNCNQDNVKLRNKRNGSKKSTRPRPYIKSIIWESWSTQRKHLINSHLLCIKVHVLQTQVFVPSWLKRKIPSPEPKKSTTNSTIVLLLNLQVNKMARLLNMGKEDNRTNSCRFPLLDSQWRRDWEELWFSF